MNDNLHQKSPKQLQKLYTQPVGPRHSGFGIASFVIAMVCIFLGLVLLIAHTIIDSQVPEEMQGYYAVKPIRFLCLVDLDLFFFIGLLLAVIGLSQSNRGKVFSILGLIFNLFFFLLIAGCIVLIIAHFLLIIIAW